jgi:hypothetical protein
VCCLAEVAPSLPDLTVVTDLNFYDPFLWIYRNPEKGFYEHLSKATWIASDLLKCILVYTSPYIKRMTMTLK